MKLVARFALAASFFAVSAMAESWTGVISDAACGAKHADASEKSMACAKACCSVNWERKNKHMIP